MKIILDGMGGDNAPFSVVEGAVLASRQTQHHICIMGQEELIIPELKKKYKYESGKTTKKKTKQINSNDDAPDRHLR